MLEERAPVPEPGEIVGDRLATSIGEALHLPETHEYPRDGEQQREGRQRHHDRVPAEGEDREDPEEVSVASIGIASIVLDRAVAISRDRCGDQIDTAMQEMPVIHSRYSQGPTA